MAVLKGVLRIVSEISLLFLIYYVFGIIRNILIIWKRSLLGEDPQSMVWNPFLLVLDEEVYGPVITKWIYVIIIIGLIYMIFWMLKLV